MRRGFIAAAGAVAIAGCGAQTGGQVPTTTRPIGYEVDLIEPGYINDIRPTGDGFGEIESLDFDIYPPSGFVDVECIDTNGETHELTIAPGNDHLSPSFVPALAPPVDIVQRGYEDRVLGRARITQEVER